MDEATISMAVKDETPEETEARMMDRQRRVYALKLLGFKHETIAKRLGVSTDTVGRDVKAMIAIRDPARVEEMRKLHSDRYEYAMSKLAVRVQKEDIDAISLFVNINEKSSKLHGTVAPVETKISGAVAVGSMDDWTNEQLHDFYESNGRIVPAIAGAAVAPGESEADPE